MTESVLSALRAVHGLFNFSVMLLFVYQASMGLKIRKGRRGGQLSAKVIGRHRRNGPVIAVLAVLGYMAGLVIVTIDKGQIFSFPPHFIFGSVLVLAIVGTYLVSRRIDEQEVWRNRHFRLGIFIMTVYLLQVLMGVGILASLASR